MSTQNYVQLELPLFPKKQEPLQQMEQVIHNMLDLTWQCVLSHISVRTTKELMRQHGCLIVLSSGKAVIRVSSLPVLRIALEKLPDIEAAFRKAFGCNIQVSLES